MAAKTPPKRKPTKKMTLSEFKTWLDGVQSMQPEGWHPTGENWAMICDQIDNIIDDKPAQRTTESFTMFLCIHDGMFIKTRAIQHTKQK